MSCNLIMLYNVMSLPFLVCHLIVLILHVSYVACDVISCPYSEGGCVLLTCPELFVDFVVLLAKLVSRSLVAISHFFIVLSYILVLLFCSRFWLTDLGFCTILLAGVCLCTITSFRGWRLRAWMLEVLLWIVLVDALLLAGLDAAVVGASKSTWSGR